MEKKAPIKAIKQLQRSLKQRLSELSIERMHPVDIANCDGHPRYALNEYGMLVWRASNTRPILRALSIQDLEAIRRQMETHLASISQQMAAPAPAP